VVQRLSPIAGNDGVGLGSPITARVPDRHGGRLAASRTADSRSAASPVSPAA